MYHFIAFGKVLPSHMYRNLGDCQNEPEIDSYIQNIGKHSKGNCEEDDLPTASSAFDHSENEDDAEDDVSDEEESFDTQLIRRNFSEAFEEYRNKILEYQSNNPQDPSINRAMIAMTKTLRRSMKCLPATIQNQMHNGKGTFAKKNVPKRVVQSKLTPLHYQEGDSKSQGGDQRLKVAPCRIGREKFKWSSLKMVI